MTDQLEGIKQMVAQNGNWLSPELAVYLLRRLEEVRRRVIVDFYTGTSAGALHYAACRLCDWTWLYGAAELHEPSCPMKEINNAIP